MKKKAGIFAVLLCIICLLCACRERHVHSFTPWQTIKPASCLEQGVITRSCEGCGISENNYINPTGHSETTLEAKEATCTEEGLTQGTGCVNCGAVLTAQQPISKLAHTEAPIEAKEATCSGEGTSGGTQCSVCKTVLTQPNTTPKTPHTEEKIKGKAATCSSEGLTDGTKCSVCGEVLVKQAGIPKKDHKYTEKITQAATPDKKGTKTYTCSVCGDKFTESFAFTGYSSEDIYKMVSASVGEVSIYNRHGQRIGIGSCFVYASDGKVVTNYHVIENAYSGKVTLNGTSYTIEQLLAYDKHIDLAVLKISGSGHKALPIASSAPATGSTVYAVGSSEGLTDTFSKGIVTHASRPLDGVSYVQNNAPVSNGNSGGPLINELGQVVGINTMSHREGQNINLAVSVSELNSLAYGSSCTLEEQYTAKNADAYFNVVDWLKVNGKQSDRYWDYYETDDDLTFNIFWDVKEERLYLALYSTTDEGTEYEFYLDLSNKYENYVYQNYITFSDGEMIYTEGYVDAATYTENTVLMPSEWDVPDSMLSSMNDLAQIHTAISLSWFELFLMEKGFDISIADFGFHMF